MSPEITVKGGTLIFNLLAGESKDDHRGVHMGVSLANDCLYLLGRRSRFDPRKLDEKAVTKLAAFIPKQTARELLRAATAKEDGLKVTFTRVDGLKANEYKVVK